jgi:CheY-like chemotaxis protein
MSGYAEELPDVRGQGSAADAVTFVAKPFRLSELAAVVDNLLAARESGP